ncbi:MAG: AI-2E family transporter [Firmicutes bacterium]|nr:AI-2E family transporter [Bacillota bacterium]
MRPPFLRWVLGLVLLLAGAALLYRLRSVLLLFVLALFLTYLIEPLVAALERRGAPRDAAVLSVFLAAAILVAGGIAIVLPALAGEIEGAIGALPGYLRRLGTATARIGEIYRRLHLPANLRTMVDRLTAQGTARLERFLGSAFAALLGLLPGSLSLLLVPVIAYAVAADKMRGTLDNLKVWLQSNNAAVMSVLLLVMGAVVLGKGFGGLF